MITDVGIKNMVDIKYINLSNNDIITDNGIKNMVNMQ
jgi:hypothetical protein